MAAAVSGAALLGKGLDISLAALRQHDPYISSIVDVASQVALYTFGHRANEWVRRGTAPPPDPKPRGARGGARGGHAHCGEAPPLSQPWGGEGVAAMLGCEGSLRDPGVPQGAVCVLKALLMGNGAGGLHGCLQGWSAPVGAGCWLPHTCCALSWLLLGAGSRAAPLFNHTSSSLYPIHTSYIVQPLSRPQLLTKLAPQTLLARHHPMELWGLFHGFAGKCDALRVGKRKEKKGLAWVWQTLSSTSFDVFLFRRRQMWRERCLFTQGESAVF